MSQAVSEAEKMVKISDLEAEVQLTRSPNSARYYKVMLRRLQEFTCSDSIDIEAIDSKFVENFSDYLLRSALAPVTVRQMLKFLRATLKPFIAPTQRADFRAVFASVNTKERPWINRVSASDVRTIVDPRGLPAPLEKIRLVFLYCLFGATTPELIDRQADVLAQQKKIEADFSKRFGGFLHDFIERLDSSKYLQGLIALSAYLHLDISPDEWTSVDGWIAAALSCGVSADRIASTVPNAHPYSKLLIDKERITLQAAEDAKEKVATSLWDLRPHWYAVRCLKGKPVDVNEILINDLPLGEDEMFQAFIVPPTPEKVRRAVGISPVERMLFLRTDSEMIGIVKSLLPEGTHLIGRGKKAAVIPESEMQTFMLLCRLSPDTLRSYFPELAPADDGISIGKTAIVTDGQFSGSVGVVRKVSDDRYTVSLVIHTLGNLRITADIPVQFLKFNPTNG